jgi:hypothetical protein
MAQAETNARKVVEQMHDKLPVELCDLVYSYLIPRHTIQAISNVFSRDFPDHPRYPRGSRESSGGAYDNQGRTSSPPPLPPPPPPFSIAAQRIFTHPNTLTQEVAYFSPDTLAKMPLSKLRNCTTRETRSRFLLRAIRGNSTDFS